MTLKIPPASQFMKTYQKSSSIAMAASDFSLMCFVVNVKSPQISSTAAKSCDIEKGLIGGSVVVGGTLTLDVPSGEANTFEIYGLLRGSLSENCPTELQNGWKWPLSKIYFLGKTAGVNIVPPESSVSVTITLPALNQNIVTQNSWSASCSPVVAVAGNPAFGRLPIAAGVLGGANYRVYSRVSNREELRPLSGSVYQIHNWKAQTY